jgi:[acyl-carrier-protein] S-malonyltransferase
MGKDFFDAFPKSEEFFDRAIQVLGWDLATLCFNGPEGRLNQTDASQPAIYVTSVACYAAAVEKGVINPEEVTAYAGLSLGEYTALHLAGVFSF